MSSVQLDERPSSQALPYAEIFVSYSRKDQAAVRRIHAALTAHGRDSWIDWEDIPPSAKWKDEVARAIEAADAFMFVVSPNSATSTVCRDEIDHAVRYNKRIIPLVLGDVDVGIVPPAVAELNWIFFRPQDDFDVQFELLLQALDTDLEWVREHTRLLVRAIEWDMQGRDASYLLRGKDLQAAEQWLARGSASGDSEPTELHRQLLSASRAWEARRHRRLLAGVSGALVVAITLAVVAMLQRNEAVTQRDIAESQRRVAVSRGLAGQALATLRDRPDLALLLAVEAVRTQDTVDARAALLRGLAANQRLARVLYARRSEGITAIAGGPTDGFVAAGTGGGDVLVWNLATGGGPTVLQGRDWMVVAIAIAPGGDWLAWLDTGGVVWAVNTARSSSPQIVGRRIGSGGDIEWNRSGDQLIVAASSGTLYRIEIASGRRYVTRLWVGSRERSMTLGPGGNIVAAGGGKSVNHVWDTATGRSLGRLGPGRVVFSADGRAVAAEANDSPYSVTGPTHGSYSPLTFGGLRRGDREMVFQSGTAGVVSNFALSPDGKLLVVQTEGRDADTSLNWVDTRSGRVLPGVHNAYAASAFYSGAFDTGMAFVDDGRYLATISSDGQRVLVWDAVGRVGTLAREIGRTQGLIAVSPNGAILATARAAPDLGPSEEPDEIDGRVTLFDAATRRRLDRFDVSQAGPITSLDFSPDSRHVAVGYLAGSHTAVWTVSGGTARAARDFEGTFAGWSGDGRAIALAHDDGVIIQSLSSSVATDELEWPGGWWRDGVSLSWHGDVVAVPGVAGVAIYDGSSGTRSRLLEFDRTLAGIVDIELTTSATMAFDPSAQRLVLGTSDQRGKLIVWNFADPPPTIPESSRLDLVEAVAFSRDGTLVATTSSAGIELWDARSGRPIGTLGPILPVKGSRLVFSTDGRWLTAFGSLYRAEGSSISASIRWSVSVDDWIATSCRIAGRGLSRVEWSRFLPGELYNPSCVGGRARS